MFDFHSCNQSTISRTCFVYLGTLLKIVNLCEVSKYDYKISCVLDIRTESFVSPTKSMNIITRLYCSIFNYRQVQIRHQLSSSFKPSSVFGKP